MGLLKIEQPIQEETTHIIIVYPENTTLPSVELMEEGSLYILIPLGVLLCTVILSLMVYLMARNRKRLWTYCKTHNGRHFLYEDNEYESTLEEDRNAVGEEEDVVDNEDNPTKSLLRGKLQIRNYENYLSTSHLSRSSNLFT